MIPGWERSPGEGNGNPLQGSCLANAVDRGAWRALQWVTESWTWLRNNNKSPNIANIGSSGFNIQSLGRHSSGYNRTALGSQGSQGERMVLALPPAWIVQGLGGHHGGQGVSRHELQCSALSCTNSCKFYGVE